MSNIPFVKAFIFGACYAAIMPALAIVSARLKKIIAMNAIGPCEIILFLGRDIKKGVQRLALHS